MMNRRSIYIDMDGVVADFEERVSEILGRKIGWGVSDLTKADWDKVTENQQLYRDLPLITESVKMVGLCRGFSHMFNVSFLTAIPREATMPSSKADKTYWLNKHFPGMEINFGPFSRDKQRYCKPFDLLIDDKPENIEQWVSKGGCAIHHTGKTAKDYEKTIKNIIQAIDFPESKIYC